MNIYQQRLYDEWITHGKIILASDFDSTLSYWKSLENQEDIAYAIEVVKLCKQVGCYLTIFTACHSERYEEIKNYCSKLELQVDSINTNPIDLPYGKSGKVYANQFIDDRTLAFRESLDQLKEVAERVRAYKAGQNLTIQNIEF